MVRISSLLTSTCLDLGVFKGFHSNNRIRTLSLSNSSSNSNSNNFRATRTREDNSSSNKEISKTSHSNSLIFQFSTRFLTSLSLGRITISITTNTEINKDNIRGSNEESNKDNSSDSRSSSVQMKNSRKKNTQKKKRDST